ARRAARGSTAPASPATATARSSSSPPSSPASGDAGGRRSRMTQSDLVRAMFARIARRYDLMNSLMTGGRHHAWRAVVARAAAAAPPGPALDLATGTADLPLALRAQGPTRLVGRADFAEGMLGQARPKLRAPHPK